MNKSMNEDLLTASNFQEAIGSIANLHRVSKTSIRMLGRYHRRLI